MYKYIRTIRTYFTIDYLLLIHIMGEFHNLDNQLMKIMISMSGYIHIGYLEKIQLNLINM